MTWVLLMNIKNMIVNLLLDNKVVLDFIDLWQFDFFKILVVCVVGFGLLLTASIYYFNKT